MIQTLLAEGLYIDLMACKTKIEALNSTLKLSKTTKWRIVRVLFEIVEEN